MNVLQNIPVKVRRWVYSLYSLAGVAVGALAVADVQVGKAPDVLAYLGVALGITAATNAVETNTATVTAPATVEVTALADTRDYVAEDGDPSDPDVGSHMAD